MSLLTGLRYELDENNAVHVWHDGQELPFIFQPHYPDGTAWADADDARSWAEAKIAELTDMESPAAPMSPNEEPRPNPWKLYEQRRLNKEAAIAKFAALGINEDEIQALLGNI